MSRSIRRRMLTVALGALLAVPWSAQAVGQPKVQRPRATAKASAGFLGSLWGSFKALWAAEGCSIDPDGARCASTSTGRTSAVAPAPNGCSIDPDGAQCSNLVASPAPEGCSIDPSGACLR